MCHRRGVTVTVSSEWTRASAVPVPSSVLPLSLCHCRYLVSQNCIKPLCDLLDTSDVRIVTVALEGLENILKVGEAEKALGTTGGANLYAQYVDEAEGLEKIENLQMHQVLSCILVVLVCSGVPSTGHGFYPGTALKLHQAGRMQHQRRGSQLVHSTVALMNEAPSGQQEQRMSLSTARSSLAGTEQRHL